MVEQSGRSNAQTDPDLGARFAFIKLIVRDLDRMTLFYRDCLGMVTARTIETPTVTERLLTFSKDKSDFYLILYFDKAGQSISFGNSHGPVGFYVADADQSCRRAVDLGATLLRAPFDVGRLRVAFVGDPEGHELEFLELQSGQSAS